MNDQDKKLEDFEKWRDDELNKAIDKCKEMESMDVYTNETKSFLLMKVPKCLIHFTRKLCNCNRNCLNKSFSSVHLDNICFSFDLNNLWYDYSFIDCDFLKKEDEDGQLIPYDSHKNLMKTIKEIKDGISELCDKGKNFENLLCNIFYLRDSCENNQNCINFYLKAFPRRNCANIDFVSQMEKLEFILNKKLISDEIELDFIQKNKNQSVEISIDKERNCMKEYYINFTEAESNKKEHVITRRDLENIVSPNEFKSIKLEFDTIESAKSQREISFSLMSLSMISTILIIILFFLGSKDSRNVKIVAPAIVMASSILFISLYCSM